MAKNTLYAYFLGDDLSSFAERFVERANQLIQSRTWICSDVWTVNQRRTASDGIAEWDLGLNLDLPDPYCEPPDWFTDVEEIVVFCIACRAEFHHDFEIGISDNERRYSEVISEITAEPPDLDYLRNFIGIAPPEKPRDA
jgi:hypothetical protein